MNWPNFAQEFTFEWAIQRHTVVIIGALEAAAATLRGMAGRLTALTVPLTAAEYPVDIQAALLQAGPQLAGTLSSLSFFFVYGNLVELHAAAAAIRILSAGLQRLELGLAFPSARNDYSTAEVQAADAAFQGLMRSLPCCQSLRLGARGAVSHQAIGRELLHATPDLVSLTLSISHLDELVSPCPHYSLHRPHVSTHPVDCRLGLRHCHFLAAALCADMLSQAMYAQGECVSTRVQELSSLTQLTKLHISSPDYQTASCSLQCLSALRRLQVLNVDVDAPCSRARLATAPPLSHSTTLTKLRWQCVPTEVRIRRCTGTVLTSLLHGSSAGIKPLRSCPGAPSCSSMLMHNCRKPCPRPHTLFALVMVLVFESWIRWVPAGSAAVHRRVGQATLT